MKHTDLRQSFPPAMLRDHHQAIALKLFPNSRLGLRVSPVQCPAFSGWQRDTIKAHRQWQGIIEKTKTEEQLSKRDLSQPWPETKVMWGHLVESQIASCSQCPGKASFMLEGYSECNDMVSDFQEYHLIGMLASTHHGKIKSSSVSSTWSDKPK